MISAIRPSGNVFARVVPMRRLSLMVKLKPESSRMRSSPTSRGSPSALTARPTGVVEGTTTSSASLPASCCAISRPLSGLDVSSCTSNWIVCS